MRYYYFISSLPTLTWGMANPPLLRDVLVSCKGVVSDSHRRVLVSLIENEPIQGVGFIHKWQTFYQDLLQTLAYYRAQSLGRTSDAYLMSSQVDVWQVVQGVLAGSDPLAQEVYLMKTLFELLSRWGSLYHPFGVEFLMVYVLQLKLLERLGQFQQKEAEKRFKQLHDSLKNKIFNDDRGILE